MSAKYRAAYRSLLRELSRSSIAPRAQRNREITQSVRAVFESYRTAPGADDAKLSRSVGNAVTFLRSQRMYNELLDRYNPLHGMSQEERVHATARRVGLDVPIEAKAEGNDK